jgi:SP family facilitated glucose transporter-like MFS transporter 1
VEEDIEEMRAEERAQQAEATISMMELICSPTLRSPLIIGVVMQLSQQLSGINAVSAPKYCVLVENIWTKPRNRKS